MKARTRARSWEAIVAGMSLVIMSMTMPFAAAADADAVVRFVNGREMVVRGHWAAGSQILFTHKLGTIGVPREFVAAIEPLRPAKKIEAAPQPVNATPLVAPDPFR